MGRELYLYVQDYGRKDLSVVLGPFYAALIDLSIRTFRAEVRPCVSSTPYGIFWAFYFFGGGWKLHVKRFGWNQGTYLFASSLGALYGATPKISVPERTEENQAP